MPNAVVTLAKVVKLVLFIAILAAIFDVSTFRLNFRGNVRPGRFLTQVKNTILVTVCVFVGVEGAAVYSGRTKNRADVGHATIIGFVVCLVLLAAVSLLLPLSLEILSQPELAELKNSSIAAVFEKTIGNWGALVIYLGLIVSVGRGFLAWTLLATASIFTPASSELCRGRVGGRCVTSPMGRDPI